MNGPQGRGYNVLHLRLWPNGRHHPLRLKLPRVMRRKKAARIAGSSKPLSAHEAGKISPHVGKSTAIVRKSVKYDEEESYPLPERLTVREEEVLSFLADGQTNAEISEREKITPKTVEKHLENIYPKLGVNSRADAAIWYWKRRLAEVQRRRE